MSDYKILKEEIKDKREAEFGQYGCKKIADTNAYSGAWTAIKADGAADAVFTTLTASLGDNLDGLTLTAGDVIYGPFTNITLTSGTVYAYNRFKI